MFRYAALFTIGLLLLASAAFWPTYLSKNWTAIDGYTHAHALFGTLWLAGLIVQPILMLRGHRLAHRALGRASLWLGPAFVVSSVLLTHFKVRRAEA